MWILEGIAAQVQIFKALQVLEVRVQLRQSVARDGQAFELRQFRNRIARVQDHERQSTQLGL